MSIPPEAFVLPPAARGSLQQRIRQMVTEGVLAGRFRAMIPASIRDKRGFVTIDGRALLLEALRLNAEEDEGEA